MALKRVWTWAQPSPPQCPPLGPLAGAANAERPAVQTDRGDGHPQPGRHLRRGPPLFQQLSHLPTALSYLVSLP